MVENKTDVSFRPTPKKTREVVRGYVPPKFSNHQGLPPVLCKGGEIHHHYFGCPVCETEVGGFTGGPITLGGDVEWGTHTDKFCRECGQKIDWSKTNWNEIYRL